MPVYWYVVGDPETQRFALKMAAEVRARKLFPNESAAQRYARVMYRETES